MVDTQVADDGLLSCLSWERVRKTDYSYKVHCCLWFLLPFYAAALFGIWRAGNLYPEEQEFCAIEVGSCRWFDCNGDHNAECHNGKCYCNLGTCAPDGFVCQNVGDLNSTWTNSSTKPYPTIPIKSGAYLHDLTYDKEEHDQRLQEDYEDTYDVAQWALVIAALVIALSSFCLSPLFVNIGKICRRALRQKVAGMAPAEKFNSIVIWFITKNSGHVKKPADNDYPLLLWFLSGEALIFFSAKWICEYNFTHSNRVACQIVPEAALWGGAICVGLSAIVWSPPRKWHPYLPGYQVMWGGSMKDRSNALEAKRLRVVHQATVWHAGTLLQLFIRLVGYNFIFLYLSSRGLFTTGLVGLMEITHRGVFQCLFLFQTDAWDRRLNKILEMNRQPNTRSEEANVTPEPANVTIEPKNVYMDLSSPMATKVCLRFFAQVMLTCTYIHGMKDDSYQLICSAKFDNRQKVMFASSLVVQFMLGTQMGSTFFHNVFEWFIMASVGPGEIEEFHVKSDGTTVEDLERRAIEGEFSEAYEALQEMHRNKAPWNTDALMAGAKAEDGVYTYQEVYKPFVELRLVKGFLVNHVIFTFLIQTVPLTLIANTDPLDFVKDCLSVAFIALLDDIQSGTKMKVRTRRVRKGQMAAAN